MCFYFLFFFSSRRRHTIFDCDWSSDVCSSDLLFSPSTINVNGAPTAKVVGAPFTLIVEGEKRQETPVGKFPQLGVKIGRASCRERVKSAMVDGTGKGKGEEGRDRGDGVRKMTV